MSEFKKKVQWIIEDYCEGLSYLEFSIDNFPEMLDRIEKEALRIHDFVGQSEQCAHTSSDIKTLRCNCCNDCGEILDVLD